MSLQFNVVADRILYDKIKHTLQQIQQDPDGMLLPYCTPGSYFNPQNWTD